MAYKHVSHTCTGALGAYDDQVPSIDLQPLEFVMALAKLTRPQIELSDEAMPNLVPRLVAVFMAGLRPDGTDLPV